MCWMGKIFSIEIDMRWADIDAYGHANNAIIFSYLETARVKLLLEPGLDIMQGPLQTLVARAECDYLKPIFFSQQVVISMEIPRLGNSSYDIHYRVHNDEGVTYAKAKTVMVCYDTELNRPVPIPDEFRASVS